MAKKPDPADTKVPGGLSMRQVHEQVKQSLLRDQQAGRTVNKLAQKQNRWQRFVHYVWDKKRGRS